MVPRYVDVSHFRAPYKNAWFGAYGADEAPPSPGPPLDVPAPDAVASLMEVKDGIYHFKPDVAAQILTQLQSVGVVQIPGSQTVQLVSFGEGTLSTKTGDVSARAWVAEKVKAGNVVLAPWWISAPIDSPRYLAAVPKGDKTSIRQGASTPYAAVLAEPGGLFGLSFTTVAIGAAVVIGAAALIGTRMRKKHSVEAAFSFK